MSEAATARGMDVEENLAVVLAGLIGLQSHTDRQAFRRAVGEIETSVVFGALNEPAFDESVREVGVAVGANAVGGV